jgi:hypothetical protein
MAVRRSNCRRGRGHQDEYRTPGTQDAPASNERSRASMRLVGHMSLSWTAKAEQLCPCAQWCCNTLTCSPGPFQRRCTVTTCPTLMQTFTLLHRRSSRAGSQTFREPAARSRRGPDLDVDDIDAYSAHGCTAVVSGRTACAKSRSIMNKDQARSGD